MTSDRTMARMAKRGLRNLGFMGLPPLLFLQDQEDTRGHHEKNQGQKDTGTVQSDGGGGVQRFGGRGAGQGQDAEKDQEKSGQEAQKDAGFADGGGGSGLGRSLGGKGLGGGALLLGQFVEGDVKAFAQGAQIVQLRNGQTGIT